MYIEYILYTESQIHNIQNNIQYITKKLGSDWSNYSKLLATHFQANTKAISF